MVLALIFIPMSGLKAILSPADLDLFNAIDLNNSKKRSAAIKNTIQSGANVNHYRCFAALIRIDDG